jgi:hypothetical protein
MLIKDTKLIVYTLLGAIRLPKLKLSSELTRPEKS